MNGWKLVPVEPVEEMIDAGCEIDARAEVQRRYAALYPDVQSPGVPAGEILKLRYASMLAAAPTPPVVLPPLPEPDALGMDFDKGWDGVRAYGHTDEALEAYARAALAQYGIKEQSDVER